MKGRQAAWAPVALAGVALLLLACAPAARVSPAPASQATGTDATSTRPYIAPRPDQQFTCAQGEAPPGHALNWTEAERLRCFPPPSTPLNTPAPIDSSTLTRAPEPRGIILKGQAVLLPEGMRRTWPIEGYCFRDQYCPPVVTFSKGSAQLTIDVSNNDDPVVWFEKIDPNDPTVFDFLKPYVRYPTPDERPRYRALGIPERDATSTPP